MMAKIAFNTNVTGMMLWRIIALIMFPRAGLTRLIRPHILFCLHSSGTCGRRKHSGMR
jgi:hypothetical protein